MVQYNLAKGHKNDGFYAGVSVSDESVVQVLGWLGGSGIFLINVSQYFLSFLALKRELRIKNNKIPDRINPAKISVSEARKPILISQMIKSQNGIQIIVPHMSPPPPSIG